MKPPPFLSVLVLIGFSLRLLFIFTSDHIYYPDEIFQTLEVGFRLVKGYSLIPWDVAYGLRSFLPGALAVLPLWLLQLINLDTPALYIPAVKIWLAFLSLSLIPATFYLSFWLTRKLNKALFAAGLTAVWYELIYFSPRAFTESLALNYFALAVLIPFIYPKRFFLYPALLTVGLLLRPQYFLLYLAGLYWQRHRLLRSLKVTVLSVLSTFFLFGLSDLFTYGSFLSHLSANIRLSLLSGISQAFGTKPWFYYPSALTAASFGLSLTPLFGLKKIRLRPLSLLLISLVLLHALLPHQEYRFLFAVIPLNLVLISQLLKSTRSVIVALVLITLLGTWHKLPFQALAYPYPPLHRDPYLKLLTVVSTQTNLCGHHSPERGWVYAGGYYRLGRQVSLTFYPQKPFATAYNYLILEQPNLELKSRPGSCTPVTSSGFYSFPQIDPLLHAVQAQPVLKTAYGGSAL